MKLTRVFSTLVLITGLGLGISSTIQATPINGDLFFTTFAGGVNVHKTTFNYDGAASFTLGAPLGIGSTVGADGLAGNPQNSNLLLVGGQGPRINTIHKTNGTATVYASPVSVFHLAVTDPTTVYGSGIPGFMAKHTINPDGSVGPGTIITLAGSNTTISTLIDTPTGFYYTAGGSGGFGNFGTLSFGPGNTATTSAIGSFAAAHGGAYDPFTNTIILMGSNHITQLDLTGAILADIIVAGQNFDQGTVDGKGHLFAASNSGHLTFIDYSASGLINVGFVSTQFLASALDDVAPLSGAGTTTPPGGSVPEPGVMALLAMGLLGARRLRYRPSEA